jgi:hypothetical protein
MDYNQLYQQYSGFTDPFGRRREEEEEDAVGNVRPVTQTIRTDPVTGEQTMTIKGSPQDLSAANPLTPTVSMPGSTAGGFMGGYQDMAPAMAPPQAPAPAMAPAMAPQQGGFLGGYQDMAPAPQMPPGAQSRIVPLEQPTPGGYDPEQMAQALQQAGSNYQQPQPIARLAQAGMSDANPPTISQQPQPTGAGGFLGGYQDMAPPVAPTPAPAIAPTPQAAPIESPEQSYANRFYKSANDPVKMNELALDKEAPGWVRQMAVKSVEMDVRQRRQEIEAQRLLKSGNSREIAREVNRDDKDQGSIFKVLFYNAIGANKLSEQEQMKLGAGSFNQQVQLADGRIAEVRTRTDGKAMYGSDLDGNPLNNKELKQIADATPPPGSKPYGSTGYDDQGRVVERYQTPTGGTVYGVIDPVTQRKMFTKIAPVGFSESKPEKGQITAVDQARFFQTEKKRLQDENENEVKRSGPGARKTDDQLNSAAQASVANMVRMYSGDGRGPASPSQGGLATANGSSAAAVNNPTGYGAKRQPDGSYTWDAYDTPQQGVAATQQAVGKYLNGQGVMKGVKPTPENVVGMWVNGNPGTGATEQGGRYAASVRRELAAAGVQLNSDGTIPNTPAANNAVTRAMIVHESGTQNAQKFLPFVGGKQPAATTTATGTTPDTATTAAAPAETNVWASTIKPEDERPKQRQNEGDTDYASRVKEFDKRRELAITAQDKYATKLGEAVDKTASQQSTVQRVRQATINNPEFFGINNKSPAYKAYINAQTDEAKREALLRLGNELKIPENKRAEFDATRQAIAQLQLNQITGSGLTAGQLNSDREAARAVMPAGDINTDPVALRATLVLRQADIDYARTKADQFEIAKTANPNINERAFNRVFDEQFGNKIFKDARDEMDRIVKSGGTGGVTVNDRGQPTVNGFTLINTRRP